MRTNTGKAITLLRRKALSAMLALDPTWDVHSVAAVMGMSRPGATYLLNSVKGPDSPPETDNAKDETH